MRPPPNRLLNSTVILYSFLILAFLSEVRFVTAVTAAGSVNFFASDVNFSKNTHFFVFLSLKLLKFSEIKGVEFLA